MANTILCIEDNPNNMLLLKRILLSFGYKVLEATNGLDGLQMAETSDADLVLLDINLPDIDGYEVIRRLRSDKNWVRSQIPIVVISANALVGDDEKALSAGCNAYVTKPVDFQELRNVVQTYLPSTDPSVGWD
jgi:two-component system cell cycle response regulator DivK